MKQVQSAKIRRKNIHIGASPASMRVMVFADCTWFLLQGF